MGQLWIQIYLPIYDNAGEEFEESHFLQTDDELIARFGGLSAQESFISGVWSHAGQTYKDRLRCLFVLTENTDENRRFLRTYKSTLKQRFSQLEILMLGYPVERF